MPYSFIFKRVTELDNKTALAENIFLANSLTETFAEIIDRNSTDSDFHFTKSVIDSNKEYPEQHFYLEADIDEFSYLFSFWKDHLIEELGIGGDIEKRFNYLREYAKVILRHNFEIDSPTDEKTLTPDTGFEEHIEEYKFWTGLVDKVIQIQKPSK